MAAHKFASLAAMFPYSRITIFALTLSLVACNDKQVTGRYVDYETGAPIAGARIEVTTRGWGFSNGQLVWDKAYSSSTETRADGSFLVSRTGSLRAEAQGYQNLIEVPATGDGPILLQGKAKRGIAPPVPGGLLRVGETQDGRPFGWSFAQNRISIDPQETDLFPLGITQSPTVRVRLSGGAGSRFYFLPATTQNIAARSYGMLLRYADAPPGRPELTEIELSEAGTLFVHTRDDRYAKVAFDPQSMSTGYGGPHPENGVKLGRHLILSYAYNPFPGADLYVDPLDLGGVVNAELAGAAAQLPSHGKPARTARKYRLDVQEQSGKLVQTVDVVLQPDVPSDFIAQGGRPLRYRFLGVKLVYRPDGIAGVRLSIEGESFIHHLEEILPNRRFAVSREFHDYSSGNARPLLLSIRELE